MPRATHVIQWSHTKGSEPGEGEQISKSASQSGLESATRLHEVGIASNRGSARHGEYVPGPCTHRPSHHGSWFLPEAVTLTFGRGAPTVGPMTGVKS